MGSYSRPTRLRSTIVSPGVFLLNSYYKDTRYKIPTGPYTWLVQRVAVANGSIQLVPKGPDSDPGPEIRTLLAALQLIVTRLPVPLCTVSKGYFFFFRSNVTIETPASAMDMVMRNCACLRFRYSRENPSFSIWRICVAMAGVNQS